MIEPTGPVTSTLGNQSPSGDNSIMGQDDFLKLLLTQLQNQDPSSPLEPHELSAQLADFSSVEQLAQIQDLLTFQIESMEYNSVIDKTAFSASLVDKHILAQGNDVSIPVDGSGQIIADIGDGGGTATITLRDEDGNEVAVRELGEVKEGRQTLELPDDLPEGKYSYELEVRNEDDKKVSVVPYVSGVVNQVIFEDGQILLRIGDIEVVLEALVEVGEGPDSGSDDDGV